VYRNNEIAYYDTLINRLHIHVDQKKSIKPLGLKIVKLLIIIVMFAVFAPSALQQTDTLNCSYLSLNSGSKNERMTSHIFSDICRRGAAW
jgi:hypothetical protein